MKRHFNIVDGILWVGMVVSLAVVLVFPVAAQSTALVRPDPVTLGLKSGGTGSLVLVFDNVQDLYGLEVHLSFDPKLIEIVDADPAKAGVQLTAADWLKSGFLAQNQADNSAGTIDFAATLLNPASPISGSKPFVTIQVRAKADGTSPLQLNKVILANRDGKSISTQVQHGIVGVSASGAPPVAPVSAGQAPGSTGSDSDVLIALAGIGAFLVALVVLVVVIVLRRRGG